MDVRRLLLTLATLLAAGAAVKTPASADYYKAAAVEYHPVQGSDGNGTLNSNAANYVTIIKEAAPKADIIVFPEGGLNFGDMEIYVQVPFGNGTKLSAPADNPALHPALILLSKAARDNQVYVAVNLHEIEVTSNATLKYNTNVVFDRNGTIVARYRKYNLFNERRDLNITQQPEHSYFDSDFGVRFGTFTCFDILFEEPALKLKDYNVTDIIFPTWWLSELPFLTAVQEQSGWSYSTGMNLIAAETNILEEGSSGSGIYGGAKGPIIYHMSNWNATSILYATIYKKGKDGNSTGEISPSSITPPKKGILKMKTDNLTNYNTEPLTPKMDPSSIKYVPNENSYSVIQNLDMDKEICHGSFCCHFQINLTVSYVPNSSINSSKVINKGDAFNNYYYMLGVYDGERNYDGAATGNIQVCAIIPCLNETIEGCARRTDGAPLISGNSTIFENIYLNSTIFRDVTISTSNLYEGAFPVPSVLEASKDTDNYGALMNSSVLIFNHTGSQASLRFHSERLGTAAIYVRYTEDSSSTSNIQVCTVLLAFSIIVQWFIGNE